MSWKIVLPFLKGDHCWVDIEITISDDEKVLLTLFAEAALLIYRVKKLGTCRAQLAWHRFHSVMKKSAVAVWNFFVLSNDVLTIQVTISFISRDFFHHLLLVERVNFEWLMTR